MGNYESLCIEMIKMAKTTLLIALLSTVLLWSVQAFSSTSTFQGNGLNPFIKSKGNRSKLSMFFGPKDDGSPGDYVCLDCGYVFTKGPKAWASLPGSWSCPPCGSIKRRFKKVPKGSAKGEIKEKKGWF